MVLGWGGPGRGDQGLEGDDDRFSRLSICGVTLGPDFWEGDYLKTSHTQDKLVLYLRVAHLFAR